MPVLLALLSGASQVYADTDAALAALGQCRKLAQDSQFETAIGICEPLAKNGVPEAQYILGEIYEHAPDDLKSESKAFEWYLKAAKQGHLAAQNNVSYKYRYGEGVKKDLKQSFYWVTKAAEHGSVDAQFNLGTMYIQGIGTKKDLRKGFEFVKKAAIQENQFAQAYLGHLYLEGVATAQNDKEAAQWFYRAAKQGHVLAQVEIGKLYEEGRGVKKDVDAAIRWFTQAALQGSDVGYGYVKYYAEQNNVLAQTDMGLILVNGDGAHDYNEAFKWLTKASKAGSAEAQYNLGLSYENGIGTQINMKQAKYWYQKSADQKFAAALNRLKTLN